jgi:hypothetical protein
VIPVIRAISLLNVRFFWMIITSRLDFWFDMLFALLLLSILGAIWRDERIIALPIIFLHYIFELRLSDARGVSISEIGWADDRFRVVFTIYVGLFLAALVGLPVFLSLFAARRGVDTNIVLGEGKYATISFMQFSGNFVWIFAIRSVSKTVEDVARTWANRHRNKSAMYLRYIHAPICPVFSLEDVTEQEEHHEDDEFRLYRHEHGIVSSSHMPIPGAIMARMVSTASRVSERTLDVEPRSKQHPSVANEVSAGYRDEEDEFTQELSTNAQSVFAPHHQRNKVQVLSSIASQVEESNEEETNGKPL